MNRKKLYQGTWNAVGGIMFAFSTVLLQLAVTRKLGIERGGAFNIAYTTAQILQYIGLFGLQIYQRTDFSARYTQRTYQITNIITTILMLLCGAVIWAFYGFGSEKGLLVLGLTLYFAIISFAEIYQNYFFIKGRLDLSGKSVLFRSLISTVSFVITLDVTENIYFAIVILIITNAVGYLYFTIVPYHKLRADTGKTDFSNVKKLLIQNISLFMVSFILIFYQNIPRYVMEYMFENNVIMGYYGILLLPITAVNMLSNFIFIPELPGFEKLVREKEFKKLYKKIAIMLRIILSIVVILSVGMYFFGTKVLEILYNIPMMEYRPLVIVMVMCGGIVCNTSLLYYLYSMFQWQNILMLSYAISTILAVFGSILVFRITDAKLSSIVIITGINYLILLAIQTIVLISKIKRSSK